SIDSLKVIKEINKHAVKHDRVIDCLLQIHIADEATKFGFDHAELIEMLRDEYFQRLQNIRIRGLMGIATNTENEKAIKDKFYDKNILVDGIKATLFRKGTIFQYIALGMCFDYNLAIKKGANMVLVGNTFFGKRVIKHYKVKEFRPHVKKLNISHCPAHI